MNQHRTHRRSFLTLLTVAMLTFLCDARAQIGGTFDWSGEWEITQVDGSPLIPEMDAWIVFTPNSDGSFNGKVYSDVGEGPVERTSQELNLHLVEPGYWYWLNAAGNSGHITYNPATQQFESHVDTGPNTGTVRAFHRA